MRIGVDASRAAYAVRTGTENYSLELVRALRALLQQEPGDDRLVLYTGRRLPPDLRPGDGCEVRQMAFPRLWTHVRLSLEMALSRPDVLFVPGHVIPLVHPRASVATIHDVGHLYYPDAYPVGQLRYLTWATRHNVRCAAHLMVDSEATKRDLAARFDVEPERMTVAYPGVSPQYFEPVSLATLNAVRQKYQLSGPYVLYVGTLQPRKNVERLVVAFAEAKRAAGFPERLVLAGRMGWLPEGILRALQEAGHQVTLAGYVPDEDLPGLYAGATAVVLPSLFEGFGMPLAEAMAAGTAVIGSTASSLPEVVGDAGLLVDPANTQELTDALIWVCTHPVERAALVGRGRERAVRFSWEAAARATLEVLRQVGERQRGLAVRW